MKRDKHLTHGFGQRSHKYIARVPNGRGYRYFYDADEYRAYQQGKSGGKKKESVWSTSGTVASVTGNQGLINAVRKAIHHLHKKHKKHKKSSNSRPSGGGGRIDY